MEQGKTRIGVTILRARICPPGGVGPRRAGGRASRGRFCAGFAAATDLARGIRQGFFGSTLPRIVNVFLGQNWESVIKSIESFTFRGTKIAQSLWREPCSRKSQIA